MAKKNKLIIGGYIDSILGENLYKLRIKKNEKRDIFPMLELDPKIRETIEKNMIIGQYVVVEGRITTKLVTKQHKCPDCGNNVEDSVIETKVTANKVHFMDVMDDSFINQVFLLGVVCKDFDFKYINGSKSGEIASTQYQIAINRNPTIDGTDYPWINSFARQAEEDARRLQSGSQVCIDGTINTKVSEREKTCEKCTKKFAIREELAEVVPISVEYLNNCVFEDKKKENT